MKIVSSLKRSEAAFTALESAIVLTAFLVVAAVFAYVVLGAGFFSIGKTKEVVHTGVDEATSSIELAGDVTAYTDGTKVLNVTIPLRLTAGRNPVNLNYTQVAVSYKDINSYAPDIYISSDNLTWVTNENQLGGTADDMLEYQELAEITVNVSNYNLQTSETFTIEVKPAQGGTLPIERTTPPSFDTLIDLL